MSEKLPFNEASGKKPFNGAYKISFILNVSSGDGVQASDVGLFLAQGLGDSLIEKVSNVDIEKIYKTSATPLKPGDIVYLNQDIVVTATVVKDSNGIFCVGSLGESVCKGYSLSLQRGLIAEVNKVAEGQAELIGFDNLIEASFIDPETDEPFCENIRVDKISVDLDAVEKISNTSTSTTNEEVA